MNILRQILENYLATHDDPKTFPESEYPEIYIELKFIREFLAQ